MSARHFSLVLCALLVSGCARFQKKPAAPSATSGPQMVGTVTLVNEALRFVLVDVGTLYTPEPGSALKCIANGQETAVLAVSPERKRPFITADIVKGTPRPGDLVFE